MKTVDSTSCWLALLFIIVSLFGFYPPITKLPIGGSFDCYIKQRFVNTSYRVLDNHVIYRRTRPIDSSDTGEEDTVCKRMREDGDDAEEYDEDEDELESGEFNSHILQMSFSPNIWSSPPCGRKHSSSSPRGSPISIRRVLQGQKAIIWQIRGGYWWHQGWHFSRSSISPSRNEKAKE